MYTLQPILQPEVCYFVPFFILAIPGLLIGGIFAMMFEPYRYLQYAMVVCCGVLAPAIISYNQEIPLPPKNEKVTGEYVGMVAEGYIETTRSGKNNSQISRKDVSNIYVQYMVPEGIVTLPASKNIPYPKYVILYKN